eukprot:s202_g10.t1
MELGGFVRHTTLSRDQRRHMMTQERGNFVIWYLRTRAETTDAAEIHVPEYRDDGEEGEEESPTEDAKAPGGATSLLENMRLDQNQALAGERWTEAGQIQQATLVLLNATSGPEPEGLSTNVATQVRNVFQRLWRWHKNRGLEERAARFHRYVEDMQSLMQ